MDDPSIAIWAYHVGMNVNAKTRIVARGNRWGGGQNAAPDEARDRIVTAARACYARQSANDTTMEHIAAQAQVGRATLYRYFPNREAVLVAVFREEVRDFLQRLGDALGEPPSFCDFFLDYLLFIVRHGPNMPLHRSFFSESTALWVSRTFVGDPESLALAVEFFQDAFDRAQRSGELAADVDLAELVEVSGRLLISMMLIPSPHSRSETDLRGYFERHIIRGIRRQA